MQEKNIYWYVLRVRTGKEEHVVEHLKDKLDSSDIPFIPQKSCIFRRKGEISYFQKPCLKGYIIIESDKQTEVFIKQVFPKVFKMKYAYKFLHYDEKYDIAMWEDERLTFAELLGVDRCIGKSIGYKVGDRVKIVSGALLGYENKILKINRKTKSAVVGVNMFGNTVPIEIDLSLVEELSADDEMPSSSQVTV